MRVRDLQQFLESFTARDKSASGQGNAISDAVIYVEVNGQLKEMNVRLDSMENKITLLTKQKEDKKNIFSFKK